MRRRVVEELTAGRKRTHWIVRGGGMAERYAIRDLDQAKRYLADKNLGDRLRHDVHLMLCHKNKTALQILGSAQRARFRGGVTLSSQLGTRTSVIAQASVGTVLRRQARSADRAAACPPTYPCCVRRRELCKAPIIARRNDAAPNGPPGAPKTILRSAACAWCSIFVFRGSCQL